MSADMITLNFQGRIPVEVGREEFEIIKLMVTDAGAIYDPKAHAKVVKELMSQGYTLSRASMLCSCAADKLDWENMQEARRMP